MKSEATQNAQYFEQYCGCLAGTLERVESMTQDIQKATCKTIKQLLNS